MLWSEFTVKYVLDAVRALFETEASSFEVRGKVYWDYANRIDEANALRAWGFSKVDNWYKSDRGRVTANYPFISAELWQRTHKISIGDYEVVWRFEPRRR